MLAYYNAMFHGPRNDNWRYFHYFCYKHRLSVLVKTASLRRYWRVPTICFSQNMKTNVYPGKPHFFLYKVRLPGFSLQGPVNVMDTRNLIVTNPTNVSCTGRRFYIVIKYGFNCVIINWVQREEFKTEAYSLGFQLFPRYPANVNATTNYDRSLLLNQVIKLPLKSS